MRQAVQDITNAAKDIAKDLPGFAALAAVQTLTSNWEDALADQHPSFDEQNAIRDIEEVITNLEVLKMRLSGKPDANLKMRAELGLDA